MAVTAPVSPASAPQVCATDGRIADGAAAPGLLDRARGAARTVRWFVRGVTRADRYDRYVAHLQRTHPDAPIPTEREFWREHYEEMERNPATRCC